MTVIPADVLAFLGKPVTPEGEDAAAPHLEAALHMVKAYTRGRGFDPTTDEPADDVAAVIISCAARLHANPTLEVNSSTGIDDATFAETPGIFKGWTLPELAVLHRYRQRAH